MTNKPKISVVGPAPEWDEELRQWLENHIAQHPHLPTSILQRSDHIGVSKTGLDAYLNRTYFNPDDGVDPKRSNIEARIRAYRDRVEGTERHAYTGGFVKTRAFAALQQACQTAITQKVIVVVYAKPGVGKTVCLQEFSVRHMQTVPISILCSRNVTPRYFVQKLATALKLDDHPPTAKLEDMISEKLRRQERPIFVDQANYLREESLGTLCYIWDVARVPIVLIGTTLLYESFTTSRLTEDVRAQLSRRVAIHYPLPELSNEEATTILRKVLGEDASPELCAAIINVTGGIFGHIDLLLKRVADLKSRNEDKLKTGKVTMEQIIRVAGTKLMIA